MSTSVNILHLVLAASTGALLTACTGSAEMTNSTTKVEAASPETTISAEVVEPDASDMTEAPATEAPASSMPAPTSEGSSTSMSSSEAQPASPEPASTQTAAQAAMQEAIAFDPIITTLGDEHPKMIDHIEKTSDTTVVLTFQTGDKACYGHRPVVEYDDDDVSFGLIAGTLPDGSQMCKAYLRTAKIQVDLEKPIGNRQVEIMDLDDVQKHLMK